MPAVYTNLYVEQGATYNTTFTIEEIKNLSGTPSGQIRKSYNSSNTTASFDASIDTSNGTITLRLDANVTANIVSGRYVYDAIVNDSANNTIIRIMEGIVDISPSVTR